MRSGLSLDLRSGEGGGRRPGAARECGAALPAYLADSLDPADPVLFINEVVESMDLAGFESRYSIVGEHAYSPRLLLKPWLFGVTQGVYSGREISRRLQWDLRFRKFWLRVRSPGRTDSQRVSESFNSRATENAF